MSESVKRVIGLEEMPANECAAKKIKEEMEEIIEEVKYVDTVAAVTAPAAPLAEEKPAAAALTAAKAEPDFETELPANMISQTIASTVAGGEMEKYKQISSNVSTLATSTTLKLTTTTSTVINTLNPITSNSLMQSKVKRIVLLPKSTVLKNYQNPSKPPNPPISVRITKLPTLLNRTQNAIAPSVIKLPTQFNETQNATKLPTQFSQTQKVTASSVTKLPTCNQTQNVIASSVTKLPTQFTQTQNVIASSVIKLPTDLNQAPNIIPPISGVVITPSSNNTTQLTTQQQPEQTLWDLNLDEIDAQKTDSDEDGYSVIDFYDDEYKVFDSADYVDEFDPLWKPSLLNYCKVFDYTGGLERKLVVKAPPTEPIAYFDLLLGSRVDFFTKLANSCSARGVKNCTSFTSKELQIFMGICLQMSSLRLHQLKQYWDNNANFGFNGFEDKMSLKFFETILNVLNFDMFECNTDNSNFNNGDLLHDKFADLKPLLNYFNWRMGTIYNCDRNLILNDPVILWKGKFNWINEVNMKFRYNAVILHWLTEPSGLVLRIVTDSEDIERKYLPQNSKTVALQRLTAAHEVLKPKLDQGRIVYASKYYSSYALALQLAKRHTYCNGLLESNRYGNSKELILTPLDKGGVIARYADDIMMGKYRKDKKNVYFYSSNCQGVFANERQSILSSLKNVANEIKSYLRHPPDIRAHMLNSQILLPIKEIKWDKRLMIYVMNLFVLNAYILYTKHTNFRNGESPIRYEKFRQEIITSLFNTHLESKHIIQAIPLLDGKIVKKKCQICYKSGLNTYSKYFCKICPGSPGLCEKPCFRIWHDALQKSTNETYTVFRQTLN